MNGILTIDRPARWKCVYCAQQRAAEAEECPGCGAPRADSGGPYVISREVNLQDLLNAKPGGVIRIMKG